MSPGRKYCIPLERKPFEDVGVLSVLCMLNPQLLEPSWQVYLHDFWNTGRPIRALRKSEHDPGSLAKWISPEKWNLKLGTTCLGVGTGGDRECYWEEIVEESHTVIAVCPLGMMGEVASCRRVRSKWSGRHIKWKVEGRKLMVTTNLQKKY